MQVDLDKLLEWVTANVYDSRHGWLGAPNWVVGSKPLLDHLAQQTELTEEEMGNGYDEARYRVYGSGIDKE